MERLVLRLNSLRMRQEAPQDTREKELQRERETKKDIMRYGL